MGEQHDELRPGREPVKTDKDGRFRVEGLVPGLKCYISARQGRTFLTGEPRIGLLEVEPGKTLELGDRRMKPAF